MIDRLGLYISNNFLNFPKDASEFGYKTDVLNGWVHFLMLILFIFWGVIFIYIVIKFSSSNNPKASYKGMKGKFSKYAEGGVILFEIFLLFALAIPGYYDIKFAKLDSDHDIEIRIVAQQFAWNIHYPGEDGIFGKTYVDSVDADKANFIGLSLEGAGADDIMTQNNLYIPKNKRVKIRLSSMDVIHSFALPEMRLKQDAIPGMEIPIYFTATMSSDEFIEWLKVNDWNRYNNKADKSTKVYVAMSNDEKDFNFRGYQITCAQLCGGSHSVMRGYMWVYETENEYIDKLIQEREEWYSANYEEDEF